MSSEKTLMHVTLLEKHAPTGKTVHTLNGAPVRATAALKLVQYVSDPGYYLIHLDEAGDEVTDTYHETIESTLAQANWEYRVQPEDWKPMAN